MNDTLDYAVQLSSQRVYGEAILYVGDPWHPSAGASISPIIMEPICELTHDPIHNTASPLSRLLTFTKTTIPENYSLSFDFTTTNTSSVWSNILQYTKDNTNAGPGGRIPGNLCF